MKINLTKKQYDTFIDVLQIAGTVYGVMGDMVDEKYKKTSQDIDELEDHVLSIAKDMGREQIVELFQGKRSVDFEYAERVIDDLNEYEEFSMWDELPRKLAGRDLFETYGEEKLKAMDEQEYWRVFGERESYYHKEFEAHGIDRLRVVDMKLKTEKEDKKK